MARYLRKLAVQASRYQRDLRKIRASLDAESIAWYPYDSIGNLWLVEKFVKSEILSDEVLASGPLLDLCCGDGDLGFALASRGCEVHAVDLPVTNMNFMRGVKRVNQILNSPLAVHEIDLDTSFELPVQFYAVTFFFGGLYHLKNPYNVLETLARHSRYCFLSTRVAKWMPDQATKVQGFPIAYLVGPQELNGDWTNYWIFSEGGLRRILERTGWEILEWATFGNAAQSDPVRPDCDERAFCVLKSTALGKAQQVALGSGWHDLEMGAWRWTERRFGFRISEAPPEASKLVLAFTIRPGLAPVTIKATANGLALPSQSFHTEGEAVYGCPLPDSVAGAPSLEFEFELDHACSGDPIDIRERGVIIRMSDLERPVA